jgi:hypothetical protein
MTVNLSIFLFDSLSLISLSFARFSSYKRFLMFKKAISHTYSFHRWCHLVCRSWYYALIVLKFRQKNKILPSESGSTSTTSLRSLLTWRIDFQPNSSKENVIQDCARHEPFSFKKMKQPDANSAGKGLRLPIIPPFLLALHSYN